MCRVVCRSPFGLCRASVLPRPTLRYFGLCRASFWCSRGACWSPSCSVLPYWPLWLFGSICIHTLGVGLSVPILCYEYLHCHSEGLWSFEWWCSWLLLPMLSRLACPVGWVGLSGRAYAGCAYSISAVSMAKCVFSTQAWEVVWYLPGALCGYWPTYQVH